MTWFGNPFGFQAPFTSLPFGYFGPGSSPTIAGVPFGFGSGALVENRMLSMMAFNPIFNSQFAASVYAGQVDPRLFAMNSPLATRVPSYPISFGMSPGLASLGGLNAVSLPYQGSIQPYAGSYQQSVYQPTTPRLAMDFIQSLASSGGVSQSQNIGVSNGINGPAGTDYLYQQALARYSKMMQQVPSPASNNGVSLQNVNNNETAKPVDHAQVTSHFGMRRDPFKGSHAFHSGVDLAGKLNAPVKSVRAGTVQAVGFDKNGYGNYVDIDHGNGLMTRYGHLNASLVKEGQTVQAGEQIGKLGSTGRSTGPHLHFEARMNNKPVDPMALLRQAESSVIAV